MSNTIFVVENHAVMREMLRDFLEMSPSLSVTGMAENAEDALDAIPEAKPDLLLIDLSLPNMSGIDFVEEVNERWPELLCLIFSAHDKPSYAQQSLAAGARGYIIKGAPDELLVAIEKVLNGDFYLSAPLRGLIDIADSTSR